MRSIFLVLSLGVLSLPAFAATPSDADYQADGLAVVHRANDATYAVDGDAAEFTNAGLDLWLQTDFQRPQANVNVPGTRTRDLAKADVDCLLHRYRFSQVRYYNPEGDMVSSDDRSSEWVEPQDGTVGADLIKEICVAYDLPVAVNMQAAN